MITWMQRHKKWLVITVWISTIAFVGAGFVGWGSYNYGSSSGNVATIGSKEIKISDLQSEYNSLYTRYQKDIGESFNQEMAKQLKLEETAYKAVVQRFTLLNYADELGLYITDKNLAKSLIQIPSFLKDGKFDKNTYLSVLRQNKTSPQEFEYQVRNDLLINKLQSIFKTNVLETESKNLSILNNMQDKVSINIIDTKNLKVQTTDNMLKKYWKANKDKYKSLKSYKLGISKVEIKDDKKASKKIALKKYLKLKKGDLEFEHIITTDENSDITIPTKLGIINKPVEYNNTYIILKLIEKIPSIVLPFKKTYNIVKNDYISSQKNILLKKKIEKLTANFKGKDIGFISPNLQQSIAGLSNEESRQFISHVFDSYTTIDSIIFQDKAIVYKITDSKILETGNIQSKTKNLLDNIKNNEIIINLLKQLQKKYEVISYMKGQ